MLSAWGATRSLDTRRVGKTELLRRFCQGKAVVLFLAAQVKEGDNLDRFMTAVREGLPGLDLSGVAFRVALNSPPCMSGTLLPSLTYSDPLS